LGGGGMVFEIKVINIILSVPSIEVGKNKIFRWEIRGFGEFSKKSYFKGESW
jgi:hypothetical protein